MPNPDHVNLYRVNPVWLMSHARWPSEARRFFFKRRFAKGVQRNITDCFNAWITADSIKTFLFYYILHSTYCLLHLQNSARRFQSCALRYNFFHAALRCSSFPFDTVIFLRLYVRSWYVQCCMLLKDSVFVLWINKLKCSLLKTSVSLVLATEHLKL